MVAPSVSLIDPNIVDTNALYFDDQYDTLVNSTSFGQGLFVYQDWTYASWYGSNGKVRIARKGPTGTEWEVAELTHSLRDYDAHNVISIGYSPLDGTIHIACDCHASPVAYSVSIPGLVTNPTAFTWSSSLFSNFTSTLGSTIIGDITYPAFFNRPDGILQLAYRIGTSGNGRLALAEYVSGNWILLGSVTENLGNWTAPNGVVSVSRNFYFAHPAYTTNGRLHVMGLWREGNMDTRCSITGFAPNHYTAYFYSDDYGRTWHNSAGTLIGVTGSTLIGVTTPGIHTPDSATNVQHAIQVDSAAVGFTRPACVQSYVRGGLLPDPDCVQSPEQRVDLATNTIRYQKADGTWAYTVVRPAGYTDYFLEYPAGRAGRSQIIVTINYDFIVIMPGIRILAASAVSGYTDWTIVFNGITEGLSAYGEVIVDRSQVLSHGIFTIAYQKNLSGHFCVRKFKIN